MKLSLKQCLFFLALSPALMAPNDACAMEERPAGNPLKQIDYRQAFDQSAIYNQFGALMTEWGCDANVLVDEGDDESECGCPLDPLSIYLLLKKGCHSLSGVKKLTQRQAFERACLAKLEDARQSAILKRASHASISMVLEATATYGMNKWLVSQESMGGSFAVFNAVMGTVHNAKEIISSVAALRQPHHHLDDLEKKYAVHKCFIPNKLWGKIEKNFEYARREDDHQSMYIDFLEFALNFTILKPQPPIEIDVEYVINTLFERIDTFLHAYHVTPWQLALLKINIRNFIENVASNAQHPMRYVYLVGDGGIGKSEFVEQLHHWIDKLMPTIIHFNKQVVESATELEGSITTKGILLKMLGDQLAYGKYGSIVLLDDAEWFKNDGPMASAAKRVFNGNLAEIKTTYFSQCDSDTGLKLPMPPMLIFVTSNSPIKDEALDTRFDIIHFPANERDALKRFALELCEGDREYQQADARTQESIRELFKNEIECEKTLQDTPMRTFRDVKLHVAPLCFYITHLRNRSGEVHLKTE